MDTLLLNSGLGAENARWALVSPAGAIRNSGQGELTVAAPLAKRARIVWLPHGEDVLLLAKDIPARRGKELQQAVPFAVEDDLASDVQNNAFGFHKTGTRVAIASVDAERLEVGHRTLVLAGIRPRQIVPDVLCVPWQAGEWSLLVEAERALLRTGEFGGLACDRANLRWILDQQLAATPDDAVPTQIRVWGDEHELAGFAVPIRPEPGGAMECLAAGAGSLGALNLTAALSGVGTLGPADRRRMAVAAACTAVAFGLHLLAQTHELNRMDRYNRLLENRIEALYREAFPEAKRVVKPRFQMEQGLRALQAGDAGDRGFLSQMVASLPALQGARGMVLETLSYQGDNLTLAFQVPDLQALDELKQRLEAVPGLAAKIQSVEKLPDKVQAVIRVKGAVS